MDEAKTLGKGQRGKYYCPVEKVSSVAQIPDMLKPQGLFMEGF